MAFRNFPKRAPEQGQFDRKKLSLQQSFVLRTSWSRRQVLTNWKRPSILGYRALVVRNKGPSFLVYMFLHVFLNHRYRLCQKTNSDWAQIALLRGQFTFGLSRSVERKKANVRGLRPSYFKALLAKWRLCVKTKCPTAIRESHSSLLYAAFQVLLFYFLVASTRGRRINSKTGS